MKSITPLLCTIATFFSLQAKAVDFNEAQLRQQRASISEKKFAGKNLTESAKNVLSLIKPMAPPNDSRCTIGGGSCDYDSDCCSDNCSSGKCQAGVGGCTIGGGSCDYDSDCCSSNCNSGKCQSGVGGCTNGAGSCDYDSDCCSGNCHSGKCQTACSVSGESCTYDFECCAGNCNNRHICGADVPPHCPQ